MINMTIVGGVLVLLGNVCLISVVRAAGWTSWSHLNFIRHVSALIGGIAIVGGMVLIIVNNL